MGTRGYKGLIRQIKRLKRIIIPFAKNKDIKFIREAVLELQEKRAGGRVRGKDILELMQAKYGIHPSLKTVYNTLKRADLVWITGRSIHPKANLETQEALKKTSEIK